MVRVPVDNGNANSSNPSFKVTTVNMAQFRPLLKREPTICNCHPYVCFRDKPCFCLFIQYWGYQKQHALRSGMLNVVMMIMCMTGLLTDNAFISWSACFCFRRRIDHFGHQNKMIHKSSWSPEISSCTPMEAFQLPLVIIVLTYLCFSSIHN